MRAREVNEGQMSVNRLFKQDGQHWRGPDHSCMTRTCSRLQSAASSSSATLFDSLNTAMQILLHHGKGTRSISRKHLLG